MRPAPAEDLQSSGLFHGADLPGARAPRACGNSQSPPAGAPRSASVRPFRPASGRLARRAQLHRLLRAPARQREYPPVLRQTGSAARIQSRSHRALSSDVRALPFASETLVLMYLVPEIACRSWFPKMSSNLMFKTVRKGLAAADGLAEGSRHIGYGRDGALVLHAHGP